MPMELGIAIDELYATGWSGLDSAGCEHTADGRPYPSVDRVRDEFRAAGFDLELRRPQLFDCVQAQWREKNGSEAGSVIATSEAEAAVYALSQFRRQLAAV
ncbi:MAG: hypothetical protein IIB55_05430 [Planctomycetes bacterium]|nr:hypothetical protein [Planctomycetota bacterium]